MRKVSNLDSGPQRRNGHSYSLLDSEIAQFNEQGYLIVDGVLTEEEMQIIDPWFEHFISGKERHRMGKDFCDMSQPYDTKMEDYRLVNAMLPTKYLPEMANNIFFKLAQNMSNQLYQHGKSSLDYEQFLAKKPQKEGAEFAMHQDLGYWPKTKNTWTATFSLALTDADIINGCLHVVPGSNKESELRQHVPKKYKDGKGSREDSHTLVIESKPEDEIIYLPVKRGSVTIHDERIVHGSAGNLSDIWRKTYIMAFRDNETIAEERALGFTHSHNDSLDWKNVI